jgi:hypothetical protein
MPSDAPSWHRVLAAAARLQELVPDAVLVGGSGAALRVQHRVSFDDDHVVRDLANRFDDLLAELEETDGWVTARVNRPFMVLGSLDGVETGIRNLIRRRPLEVEALQTPDGTIRVPTLAEMARVKGWMILRRNATRDYLDFAALADQLGARAPALVRGMDRYYADQRGPDGLRVATQLCKQLAEPAPYDLSDIDLAHYRSLAERWQDWSEVVSVCRRVAVATLDTGDEAEK